MDVAWKIFRSTLSCISGGILGISSPPTVIEQKSLDLWTSVRKEKNHVMFLILKQLSDLSKKLVSYFHHSITLKYVLYLYKLSLSV